MKIGLVPFTVAVNVSTISNPNLWIDQTGASTLNAENLALPTTWSTETTQAQTLLGLFSKMSNAPWQGCVRQRPEPYDTSDAAPDTLLPDTLFVPYFAPDEPDGGGYSNSYLPDGLFPDGTSDQTKQRDTAKYLNGTVSSWGGASPNLYCPAQPLQALTDTKTGIINAVNAMQANGNTVLPAGLMWGWHVLSPNAPIGTGTAYEDTSVLKAIVLVTDGQNMVNGGCCGDNKSTYTAYGYAGTGGHLGTDLSSGGPEAALDAKFSTLCTNIKNKGIVIYTIALGAGVGSTGATF